MLDFLKSLCPALFFWSGVFAFVFGIPILIEIADDYDMKDWHFSAIMTPVTLAYFVFIAWGTAKLGHWYVHGSWKG